MIPVPAQEECASAGPVSPAGQPGQWLTWFSLIRKRTSLCTTGSTCTVSTYGAGS